MFPGLPIHVVGSYLFFGNLDFLNFSLNTLQSNIAKESGIAILQLICMEGVVVGVANIISI